jgi:hypothetical protein
MKLAVPLVLAASLALALPGAAAAHRNPSDASIAAHLRKAESALSTAAAALTRAGALRSLRRADRNLVAANREAARLEAAENPIPAELRERLSQVLDEGTDAVLAFLALAGRAQSLVPTFGLMTLVNPATLVIGNITTAKDLLKQLLLGPGGA